MEQLRPGLGVLPVLATDSEITESFQRDLLRMAGTGDDAQLVETDAESIMQIIGDDDVQGGDHTFYGRDHHFMTHVAADLIERLLHVRRRDSEDEHVRLRDGLVDIR